MIELTFETTEFNAVPEDDNVHTTFMIFDNSLVIKTTAVHGEVLSQTEIEMKDAIKLAKVILI